MYGCLPQLHWRDQLFIAKTEHIQRVSDIYKQACQNLLTYNSLTRAVNSPSGDKFIWKFSKTGLTKCDLHWASFSQGFHTAHHPSTSPSYITMYHAKHYKALHAQVNFI